MTEFTHASVIPLIGGEVIGSERAFGSRPLWFASYTPFQPNERHLLAYYDHEVPYHLVDEGDHPHEKVDVVSSVCPCAGLSGIHNSFGADNPNNRWLTETAEYVLGELRPRVFWGENAPMFASNVGKPVRDKMYETARKNGYVMTVYRTKNLLHGVPQIRNRSFYFFWKDTVTPILEWFSRPYERVEDVVDSVRQVNSLQWPVNPDTPSHDPYYRMIFDIGLFSTKEELLAALPKTTTALRAMTTNGVTIDDVVNWLRKHEDEYPRTLKANERRLEKVRNGLGYMDRDTLLMKDHTGAFVLHYPRQLVHHDEDRYVTMRESLAIMGMPNDFMLLEDEKGEYPINHVCQNVVPRTAEDMAGQVVKYLGGELDSNRSTYTYQSNVNHRTEIWDSESMTLDV